MCTRLTVLLVMTSVLCSACAFRTQERRVTMSQINKSPKRTRMTNFLDAPLRPGSPTEQANSQVSRAVLMDEAQISKLTQDELCIAVIQRTHVSIDVPLGMWEAKINGQEVYIDEGPISVEDHSVTGERTVLAADAILPEAFGSFRLTEPTQEVYRVFKREGTICTPSADVGQRVELELLLPQDDARGNWGQKYVWNVQ